MKKTEKGLSQRSFAPKKQKPTDSRGRQTQRNGQRYRQTEGQKTDIKDKQIDRLEDWQRADKIDRQTDIDRQIYIDRQRDINIKTERQSKSGETEEDRKYTKTNRKYRY